MPKRKYSSYAKGGKVGRMGNKYVSSGLKSAFKSGKVLKDLQQLRKRMRTIDRSIETKEGLRSFSGGTNIALAHNNIYSLQNTLLNTDNGNQDPMNAIGQRVGDQITLKGVAIKMLLQNQAGRPKVFYRVMVVRSAKSDAPTRATLFKGLSGNKMIDQFNTERYTILASKRVNVIAQGNAAWNSVTLSGEPRTDNGATQIGGVPTKIVSMWIPGKKFGRNGIIQYESSTGQPKFFDYHLIVMAYDWFGTPQDVNNVGAVSDGWIKQYFKDA